MAEGHAGAVSIVGLSFRLPLADDLAALEAVLAEGSRAPGPVPPGRFRADLADYEALRATERPAAFFGAFLADVEGFDARRFGISASDAPKIDPRQRVLLEEAAAALADAGSGPHNRRTGVFIGASNDDYALSLGRDPVEADLTTVLGNSLGMLASRVSHALDLGGPSVVVDTACSSALVALHQARQALLRGDCDLAVVGAINLILSPHLHLAFSRARMLSDRGQVSPFDDAADGYVRAEAAVVFVLARARDALRDGRPSYGDIAGSSTNQDGHTRPIVTPSVAAQVEVIRAALADAGAVPGDLSYVEAHGTGTRVGDRVEYAALAEVLRGRPSPCVVGTAKATFGHAEPASGAVGVLQVVAALRRGALPALPGHEVLARHITAEPSLILLPSRAIPWRGPHRLAGVSAFGVGGTNAHVVVAEPILARRDPPLPRPRDDSGQRFWKPTPPPPARLPIAANVDEATILADLQARFTAVTGLAGKPSPDQPLLELGVDSLELMSLARGVESRYRVVLPLEALLQPGVTLRGLAGVVGHAPEGPEPAARPSATRAFAPHEADLPSHHPDTDAIVAAFTARTPGSRALAASHRTTLADNRNSAGYRPRTQAMTYPIVADRGAGARVWDVDGNEYIDVSMGFGVHLYGHGPGFITEAVAEALARGAPLGPQSPIAGEVAGLLAEMTGLDRFTFTNSGTEAVMLACRLARAATGRPTIVVFEGAYHGTFDGVLGHGRGTGEGAAPLAPGTAEGMVADLVVLPWAQEESLGAIEALGAGLAAVLVEPVQSRRPGVQPARFLAALREITSRLGAALVFDEVITGFRCGIGGAQALFGVRADLAVYGKIVGGGLPIGVVGGAQRFLDRVDGGAWREGDGSSPRTDLVFFAGTFCKHPLTMAAARATLLALRRDGERLTAELTARTAALAARLNGRLAEEGLELEVVTFASLFRFQSPRNTELFFAALNTAGVYVWEGRTMFLSAAHGDAELDLIEERALDAARRTLSPQRWPLSPCQRRFLDGGRCPRWGNLGFAVRLDGGVDEARLSEAIAATAGRHEILRARFDEGPVSQRFVGPARVEHRVVLGGATGQALAAMADHDFDLAEGPVLIFRWFPDPDGGVLAGLTHGVVLDGQSVGTLLEEIVGRCVDGSPPLEAPTRWTHPDRSGPILTRALGSALALLPEGLPAGPNPAPEARPDWRAGRVHRVTTPDEYRQITAARGGSSTLFSWLFAAFAEALAAWPGGRPGALVVPVSDRREAGAERVVGNLTHLVAVALGPSDEPRAAVAARVSRSVALPPVPLDDVLVALGAAGLPAVAPRMLFNVEPLRRLPALAGIRWSEVEFPRTEARFDVAVHVLDSGEALRIDLDFRLDRADEGAVRSLADRMVALAGDRR